MVKSVRIFKQLINSVKSITKVREIKSSFIEFTHPGFSHAKFQVVTFHQQVFGLGNKTYEHYNKMAIYVDKRLEELGATRVFECGLGDDDAK